MRIQRATDAYNGQFKEPLKVRPGQLNDNVIIGMIRPTVEAAVAFLFGKEVRFGVDIDQEEDDGEGLGDAEVGGSVVEDETDAEDDPTSAAIAPKKAGPTPQQEALDNVWRANRKMKLLKKAGVAGALAGHVFIKIIPDGVQFKGKKYPRLVLLDPMAVSVEVDPDDADVILAYNITRKTADSSGGSVERRQRIERTDIAPGEIVILDGPARWQIVDEVRRPGGPWQQENVERWPYAWCPVHDCQNLPEAFAIWGAPDVNDALIRINSTIIFLASNMTRIIKLFAHPRQWVRGMRGTELNVDPDEAIQLPGKDSEIGLVEMNGDLAGIIAAIEMLRGWYEETTHVPGIALGRLSDMPRGGVSGVALELMYQALITRTNDKRESFGEMLVALCSHLLEVMGMGRDLDVTIQWQNVLPIDRAALATSLPAWHDAGVSWDTLLGEAGYDFEDELAKSSAEKLAAAKRSQAMMKATGLPPTPFGGPQPPNGANPNDQNAPQPSGQPQGPGSPPNPAQANGSKTGKKAPAQKQPGAAA